MPKITEIDLLFLKNYLRVDYNEDDNLINLFFLSAKSYIEKYIGKKFSEMETDQIPYEYTIACLGLISHWYENRSITTEETLKDIPIGFEKLLDMTSINF